jgi:3-dehydroquinate synthase
VRRVSSSGLSRDYDVLVGRGLLAGAGAEIERRLGGRQAVVCCDENVAPLYLEEVRRSLTDAGYSVSHVVIPAGEAQKDLARAEEMYGVFYDRGVRRTDVVVALGGGVVGDLVGFVAATYQRGVRFVQLPTTLLAQVDAGIGGKVAVDFRSGKNYVGTFYQPRLVVCDLDTLVTLPKAELHGGSAEVAKYALLAGGDLWSWADALAGGGLTAAGIADHLVAACVSYKLAVVAADEREETGRRALLNLGHTIGHAIEAATSFRRFSHGEAVALGLHAALWLSQRLCGLSAVEEQAGHDLLDGLGLPRRLDGLTAEQVVSLTGRDKKAGDDGVGYVLLEAVGAPRAGVRVPHALELEVVEWLLAR